MSQTHTRHDSPVTFTLNEVARICRFDAARLRQWVAAGRLVPAVRGRRGPGGSHLFTPQQMIGFAFALAFAPKRCSTEEAVARIGQFARWPWSAVEHFFDIRHDEFTEEAFAKIFGRARRSTGELDDETHALCARLRAHLLEIRAEVRRRVFEEAARIESGNRVTRTAVDPDAIFRRFIGARK